MAINNSIRKTPFIISLPFNLFLNKLKYQVKQFDLKSLKDYDKGNSFSLRKVG